MKMKGFSKIYKFVNWSFTVSIKENLEKMIGVYKESKDIIIEALEEDEDDILLNLSIIESNIRRLNGSYALESFGGSEGNVFMLTLPMNQSLKK